MPRTFSASDDAVIFRIAELFLKEEDRLPVDKIVKMVNEEFSLDKKISRESLYPLLAKARSRKFLKLVPPIEKTLANEIVEKFQLKPESCRVVDCSQPESNELVSASAAEMVMELARNLAVSSKQPITIGLGPGRATLDFSKHFSQLLLAEKTLPRIGLVAIAAGCPADHPEYSSISFFNLFPQSRVQSRVGLFAETLVRQRDFAEIQKRPGAKEAFEAKSKINIVVTGMGQMNDDHDLFRIFHEKTGSVEWLKRKNAIGNVQYRPYSPEGPILEHEKDQLRAVTVFELSDLVSLATQKDKHVVLIARTCGACKQTRAKSLRPLLKHENSNKLRVFSEIVMDSMTAEELLREET
jgi:DNA-binding transcriptional regulator LsrR (DeoR family)